MLHYPFSQRLSRVRLWAVAGTLAPATLVQLVPNILQNGLGIIDIIFCMFQEEKGTDSILFHHLLSNMSAVNLLTNTSNVF